ncbi:MAG: hypothetical protein CMF99_09040 [Candidatus Marinimicrobia bacterium]|nr:hypothetical protein [Candidatus Neomarinimicrobiota bacterium]|tara:strand:+ start:3607 stop:5523 length:1917 start_codon:yes stop_codon:yes gene_type:complete
METQKKRQNNESGMILMASTMGIFIILSIFAFYLARFSITETRNGAYHVLDIKARNLALTGAEHGMYIYKSSRNNDGVNINNISGNLNNGVYVVSFDSDNNELTQALPYTQYLTMMSSATIDDVKRNIRYIISSLPEAFCFSFYGNNSSNHTFSNSNGTISGDMFFNGSVGSGSGTSSGITYISSGSGGTQISSFPSFPYIDSTLYENLLTSAAQSPGVYTNYSLNFDGSNQYIQISNSNDINTGSNNHSQKTIEAWFSVDNKDITSRKQTIYEQGGAVRGLNIYIYGGSLYVGGWNEPSNESNWNPGTFLSTSSIENNTWYHVALTLDGGSSVTSNAFKGYLNGVEFGSGDGSKLWNHGGDVSVARNRDTKFHSGDYNSAKYFDGKIDEVRLWNITRTQAQIASKKDTVLNGDENGLTSYFNFQENSGSIANDTQTQSNNDGSIINSPSWVSGPDLSKMSNSSYLNETVNLSSFSNNQLLVNNSLTISGSTFNGPGYIVADGNITISSSSAINGNIFIISSGSITITDSQVGTDINTPVICYSKGNASYSNSNIYGLIVSKGSSLALDGSDVYGAILNYSSSFSLDGDTDIIGSVVSKYAADLQSNLVSITKGNIPEFAGLSIGLDPFVVPGSYLEY